MKEMVSNMNGGVSSKIIIGAIAYVAIMTVMLVLCFVNPEFKNLDDIIITFVVTAASLLGLQTVENMSNIKGGKKDRHGHDEY